MNFKLILAALVTAVVPVGLFFSYIFFHSESRINSEEHNHASHTHDVDEVDLSVEYSQVENTLAQTTSSPDMSIPVTTDPEIDTETESVFETITIHKVDITKLPIGDGKISTGPKRGYVYSCQTQFSAFKANADHAGDWVDGDTWDLTKKLAVQGSVSWPEAWFKITISGLKRLLTGNGLPVGSNTGIFPVATTDPAYKIDRNPNAISAQNVNHSLPTNPTFATSASCVPMGAVGIMLNGAAVYNALDAGGRDAVANEVQDKCNGHPQGVGEYHYHGPSDCVSGAEEKNRLIGYALDGFGIYSKYDANGSEYTNADLEECHGITSEIEWNGKMVEMYHYVMTEEYPYTIGCFRGTPVVTETNRGVQNESGSTQTKTQNQPGGNTPPSEATAACTSKSTNERCSFNTPKSTVSGTCKTPPNSTTLTCVPASGPPQ